jgi:RimJ/RimL family protein N-acetyltransferase
LAEARPLSSDGLRLVPLASEHLAAVGELLDDDDTLRFTRVPVPVPDGFPRTWLEAYEAGRRDGTREAFAAVDGDGSFVGLALAPDIDREGREVELGYVVSPAARGRGVATRMLALLTQWAFDELGVLRIALIIDAANPASERVAARCGYVREGVMRSTHLKNGIRIDAGIWSRLASDQVRGGAASPSGRSGPARPGH